MTRMVAVALTLVAIAAPLSAQTPKTPLRMAASSYATVEVHVNQRPIDKQWYEEDASLSGPSRIAISYGQPHARGRKIVGGLIPNDTVWRFGSNMATALHTDVDLTLGDLAVPRGDYTLFLLHSTDKWQLIVNSQTAMWGTDRSAARDFGRVTMAARKMSDNEETLTIYLVPTSQQPSTGYATLGGVMRVRWGTIELSAPWQVKQ